MKQSFVGQLGSITAGLVCVFGVALGASGAPAADQGWPHWRGPNDDGTAPAADPPTTWSETQNVRWKVKLPGSGSATPLVLGDRVFIQAAVPTGKHAEPAPEAAKPENAEPPPGPPGRGGRRGFRGPKPTEVYQFAVVCLDRASGKVLWQQVAREEVPHEGFRQNEGSFASSSGITDGQHVFAYFGSRGLYSYDLDGKLEWSRDLGKMKIAMGFGEGSSPALHGDILVVNWDNEDGSAIMALDKRTGKTLWKEARDEGTSWSTPLILQVQGKPQVVVSATRKIRSYDLATGKVIWECGGLTRNVIPSPVADGDTVYCMSGFQGNSLLAIRLGKSGDLTDSDAIAWSYKKSTPYVPSPLLYGGKLYFYASNNGILSCLDAKTGKPLINAERLEELGGVYASPVGAGGRVYLTGRGGTTLVLKAADKLENLATNRLDEKFDASPAVAGKEIFLRGKEYLYCLGAK